MGKIDTYKAYTVKDLENENDDGEYDARDHEHAAEMHADEYDSGETYLEVTEIESGQKKKFRTEACVRYACYECQ